MNHGPGSSASAALPVRALIINGPHSIAIIKSRFNAHYFAVSFLEGPAAALTASKDFDNGHYQWPPQHGIRAFGRVYSAWAYGQTVSTGLSMHARTCTPYTALTPSISGSDSINTYMMACTYSLHATLQ